MDALPVCTGLFKVLVNDAPCHGGAGSYPPPGEWTEPISEPVCCSRGYHLTTDPLRWWKPKAALWVAEGRGPLDGDGEDKAAFSSVRRGYRIDWTWPFLPLYPRVRAFLAASARSFDPQADVSGADLSGANLSCANLSRANLSHANLSHANLSRAYLSGADLFDANLSCAYRPYGPPVGWHADTNGFLRRAEG